MLEGAVVSEGDTAVGGGVVVVAEGDCEFFLGLPGPRRGVTGTVELSSSLTAVPPRVFFVGCFEVSSAPSPSSTPLLLLSFSSDFLFLVLDNAPAAVPLL